MPSPRLVSLETTAGDPGNPAMLRRTVVPARKEHIWPFRFRTKCVFFTGLHWPGDNRPICRKDAIEVDEDQA